MEKLMILGSREFETGETKHRVLFWYAISTPIQDFLGVKMSPQKRGDLPPDARQKIIARDASIRGALAPGDPAYGEQDFTNLDDGDAGFEVVDCTQAGETLDAFAARMRTYHGQRQARWIERHRREHAQAGLATS